MKLFTIGPVALYQSTKEVRLHDFVYFRSEEFSEITKNCLHKLSKLIGNNVPDSLIYFSLSGTGAMEATIENCVSDNDKVLVVDGGAFGHRFCELLQYHKKNYSSICLKWNESLTGEHLKKFDNQGYTMFFVNHHETHTGQLYDIKLIADFCKKNNMYLVVDAISSFLADEYDMEKNGIDLTIISSQKGLCLSPGMSFVSLSERMLNKIENMSFPASKYFDFKDYLNNILRGQTPYTPPVLVMYELQDMLDLIDKEGGLNERLTTIRKKAEYFRNKVKSLGFTVPNYNLSNAITPIFFHNVDAKEIVNVLKNQYKIYVNPCGGDLAHNLLRVAHIGNTSFDDIDDLIEKIVTCVDVVKNKL